MPRYIDADKLIETYKGNILTAQTDYAEGCRDIIEDIKNAPAADVQEVKHAHWEEAKRRGCVTYAKVYAECSYCHSEPVLDGRDYEYCPHCGAKMDGESQ